MQKAFTGKEGRCSHSKLQLGCSSGVYRVPGNKAEICLLRDELQKDLAGADFTDEVCCCVVALLFQFSGVCGD